MKTLGEIAVEAGLITKAAAAKAGRIADEKKQPLVVVLVREQKVDELALVAAIKKQTRVPLIDVASVRVDPEALRVLARDVCARLRVLPLALSTDHGSKVLRVAMADPTDTTAIAELEHLAQCEIDICALPLAAIEELVERSYKGFVTAVRQVARPAKSKRITQSGLEREEISVTAQIPLTSLRDAARDAAHNDVELRLTALIQILMGKGMITEEELAEAIRKLTV